MTRETEGKWDLGWGVCKFFNRQSKAFGKRCKLPLNLRVPQMRMDNGLCGVIQSG